MSSQIVGKTIWVTGASTGIGAELSRLLAASGNFVYVSARSEDKLQHLLASYPANIQPLPLDVGDIGSCDAAEKKLNAFTDHLDLVIICAGTCEYDDGPHLSLDVYERVMRTNFLGAINTVRIALPLLQNSSLGARIVGVSSLSALAPFPRAEAYGASKVALEYFLQSLKVDLADQNIGVTVVRPGFVDTPMTEKNDFSMPFIISCRSAADKILMGIAKEKLFVNFPWKMSVPLTLFGMLPRLWLNSIAPKFRKTETL